MLTAFNAVLGGVSLVYVAFKQTSTAVGAMGRGGSGCGGGEGWGAGGGMGGRSRCN